MSGSRWLCAVYLAAVFFYYPAVQIVQACSIDGIASIALNGNTALRTTDGATAATVSYWAPFTFGQSYAPGDHLAFSEDRGKLRATLSAATLAQAFRWSFGDGQGVQAAQASHAYQQPGWYRLSVSGYVAVQHNWIVFDKAEVHIVPAAQLWQANLGYRFLQVGVWISKFLAYGGWLLFIAIPFYWRRRRRARRTHTPQPSVVPSP